ncbi:MAG: hypothetical protein QG585_108, partial [Patescibacteria group bacterium]|nr:hypothetical protein [Patescibacteria group bacterium]
NLSVINAAWEVFRDLANILFIFLLLYLSIQTILQTDGGEVKHTLSKLIIVALLLNFSLFFTKVIIDSSNILTISIYEKVKPSDGNLGLADAFMGVFQFQKLYSQQGMEKFNNTGNIDLGQAGRTFAEQQGGNAWATFIMGSIMIVIATFVFIAVIAIFIKRLVVLILLMVTAPLAFVASIFPKTSGMAEEIWWGNLIKNAFYAPLFMVFIWISLKILTVKDFIGTVKGSENAIVPIVVGFIVAIAFLLISLVAAESLHVAGAHTAMKWYTGMQSWAGKNSFGRAAYNMLEKNHPIGGALYEWSKSRNPIVNTFARMGKHGLHHAANANFDKVPGTGGGHGDHGHGDSHAQGGYAKKLKEDVKERQEFRGDQQKHDASLWLDDFIIDKKFIDRDADGKPKLKSNAGYSHDVKAMEQDYESMSLEDKSEYIKAAKYKADEFRDKWVTEGGAENLEKADAIEAVANHMRYSRTDAKEQEQLERKMESVSTIDKAQLHKIMSSVKTANSSYEQVKASKGEGAPETKKAFSNLNIVKERADKFFGGLTERKRAEVIAGQGTEKQKELLRNPHFEQLAKKHITTYSQIDAMTKGGTTDPEMKKLASNISYTAKGRFELLKDVEHKDHKGNKALQDKFKEDVKEFVTPKPGQKYEDMDISEVIAQYKNKQATDDETFFNADKNLSRTLPSNPAYVARKEEIEKIKNTKKTSSTNP